MEDNRLKDTESTDHSITLAEAAVMTAQYRTENPGAVLGGLFSKSAIEAILNQPTCTGLRYYYAVDNSAPTIVLTGVDAAGNDIDTGELAQHSLPCPPTSSTPNPLNS